MSPDRPLTCANILLVYLQHFSKFKKPYNHLYVQVHDDINIDFEKKLNKDDNKPDHTSVQVYYWTIERTERKR